MANPNPDQSGLRPVKPGEVRNPKGINNKNKRFTDALIKMLDDTGLEQNFIKAGLEQAIKHRDFNFWKYIYERIEGKMPEKGDKDDELDAPESIDAHGNPLDP